MSYLFRTKAEDIFIPERFQQAIVLHVLKNMLKKVDVRVPLLLGIHGPSGEGKTVQCENVLKKMGVKRFLISGGQLDNPLSGEPARLVRATYLRAGEEVKGGECSLAVLLVNDIDTGLSASGSGNLYTTNQQTVFGELMHLVDYPTNVEGRDTLRIPVIITGNDFTRLYQPLVRAGRMTSFEWIPTFEEKAGIVSRIFPELDSQECTRLITEINLEVGIDPYDLRRSLPVAFYAHLRSILLDETLWNVVEESGIHGAVDELLKGNEPDFSIGIQYPRVFDQGVILARSNQFFNYLQTP